MPRQARKLSRTGVYHVMLRGINRQDIFEDDEDYRQMTGCLRSLTERYDEMITRTVPTIPRDYPYLPGNTFMYIKSNNSGITIYRRR